MGSQGKSRKFRRTIDAITLSMSIAIIFWGCSVTRIMTPESGWKTYSNSRYGFEFPYPSHWTIIATPENADGIAFVSPDDQYIQIRSWASHQLPEQNLGIKRKVNFNFQTAQGVPGVMVVDVGQQLTSMQLTVNKSNLKYQLYTQSDNQKFPKYYRLFYYIAQQYRIQNAKYPTGR